MFDCLGAAAPGAGGLGKGRTYASMCVRDGEGVGGTGGVRRWLASGRPRKAGRTPAAGTRTPCPFASGGKCQGFLSTAGSGGESHLDWCGISFRRAFGDIAPAVLGDRVVVQHVLRLGPSRVCQASWSAAVATGMPPTRILSAYRSLQEGRSPGANVGATPGGGQGLSSGRPKAAVEG